MPPASLSQRPDPAIAYEKARQLARTNSWREKALIYVTRSPGELLVLEHTGDERDSAGLQVPAGGVDPGEEPVQTAERELAEETGLRVDGPPPVYLESRVWEGVAPSRIRHYFWVIAPPGTPDAWSHTVTAGEADKGMLFRLSFRQRNSPGLMPGFGWDSALGHLDAAITQNRR